MKKTIGFYVKNNYGTATEYIHPDFASDASLIQQLTGQKTINSRIRELIRDLTGCAVDFRQVTAPIGMSTFAR